MSIYLITKTDSNTNHLGRTNVEVLKTEMIGFKTCHADASSYLHDRSKEEKYKGWGYLLYPQYKMEEVHEIEPESNLIMNDGNKIMAKLFDQFGRGVYTILDYSLYDHNTNKPSAVIEHEDGTPTTIYYDKEKGEWR